MHRIIAIVVLFSFFLSLASPFLWAAENMTKVYVNGVKLNVLPTMQEGVAYLPANSLAQALGITISWDPNMRIIKINNQVVASSPLITDGKLYLPVESIATGAGASVEWDGVSGSIRISKSGAVPPVVSVDTSAQSKVKAPADAIAPEKAPVAVSTPVEPKTKIDAPFMAPDKIKAPDVEVSYQPPVKGATGKSKPTDTITHKPPATYAGQPPKSAYPDAQKSDSPIRPKDAPPTMPSNLSLPPMYTTEQVSSPGATYATTSSFVPRSESNGVFRVSVTNVEVVDSIKDYYKPKPGYKFVIVNLSQQNISDQVQIYTGRFSLLDQNNRSYDYIEGLSNYWLVILRPGGINFGYLVFELPADSKPMSTVLHGLNQAPLTVGLN